MELTKFLVGRDGRVLKRYEPPVTPEEIRSDLVEVLHCERSAAAPRR